MHPLQFPWPISVAVAPELVYLNSLTPPTKSVVESFGSTASVRMFSQTARGPGGFSSQGVFGPPGPTTPDQCVPPSTV